MHKLSKTQQNVYDQMKAGVWYSAYDLHAGLNTLFALYKKGYVTKSFPRAGDWFFPRNSIQFKRKEE